jgi:uncharacterized protein (TIRG00374 family)
LFQKLKQKILLSIAVSGLVYLAFIIYADFNEVVSAFSKFNWLLLPLLLFLSLLNYLVRFIKWNYYLSLLKIKITRTDSFSIFMSGLVMSVTPGKMGELLKSYLVKQINGTPISTTAPIVFVERITDFVSLMILALIGAYTFNYGRTIVAVVAIFFTLVLIIMSNRRIALLIILLLSKLKFLQKHLQSIHNAYESSYKLLRPLPLLYMTLVSLVSWFFECLGYHLILINFGIDVGLFWATFSYAFATIVGAVSMLPGGLGVTEGSLTFLLIQSGYPNEYAVASTFIVRAVTLWFAVLVGIISVSIYQNKFGKINVESISN